jgi:hypothetical protein
MYRSVGKDGLEELWTLKRHGKFNAAGSWAKVDGVKPKWKRKSKDY